jgi:copper(I)-binding protein
MVSRFVSRPLRVVPVAILAATLGLTGCSAGQVTQTDSIPPAVNGNLGQVGTILLRDALIAYPAEGKYSKDGSAPLVLSIVNIGPDDDELTDVSSPAATDFEMIGNPKVPSGMALIVVAPEKDDEAGHGTSSEAPTTTTTPGGETTGAGATTTTTPGDDTSETTTTTTTESSESQAGKETTEVVGRISILLSKLRSGLPVGKTVPVTFTFARAGQITLDLPIANPEEPREDVTGAEGEGH